VRLAVEVTTCTAARAGIGYYTEHLVDALLETRAPGDELVLISNRALAPEITRRWASNLHVEGVASRALWMQTDAPRLLAELGADVAAFPNYVIPLASPCPTIAFVHDLALLRMPELFTVRKRLVMGPLVRKSASAAALVATVSEASRRDIIAWLGVDPERIVLLPGAPHPSCGPVAPSDAAAVRAVHGLARPYVLTVGTLEPRKNLLTLLDAFDQLASEGNRAAADLDLVVVGGRGWRDRRLLRALGARSALGHVRWLGYVSERELIALYGDAALFVYPSRLEGFGLPVIEALACGTPVIASDVPALREVAGDAASFVPPGDAGALAGAIARLLADPTTAARARAEGPRRAQAFSWLRTAERLWTIAREKGPTRERSFPARGAAAPGVGLRPVSVPVTPLSAAAPAPGPATPAAIPAMPDPTGTPPGRLRPREWALLGAVTYADLFDAPLPVEEAASWGAGGSLDPGEVRRIVTGGALAAHVTLHPAGYLVLPGRETLVERRLEGVSRTAALLDRHRRTLEVLATLPFVRMLAFSGGTAHHNPGAKPDIDLFVVAAGGHAYTAYTLLFAATKLTRTRGIVCPNYLVDERELKIAYHHDLFTAHQLVSTRPISGHATYLAFCEANADWVRRFFPGFRPRPGNAPTGWPSLQRAAELAFGPATGPLERFLRWGWRAHMRQRAARARAADVVLANGILKLHLSDYRRRVLQKFGARLSALRSHLEAQEDREQEEREEEESTSTGARAARP
jgi:glycosyltransferase involved in cell wall biosynthesis